MLLGDAVEGIARLHDVAAGCRDNQLLAGVELIGRGQVVGLDQHIDRHAELPGDGIDGVAGNHRIGLAAERCDRRGGRRLGRLLDLLGAGIEIALAAGEKQRQQRQPKMDSADSDHRRARS